MSNEVNEYIDPFYKKSLQGKQGNLFTRVEVLEELVKNLQIKNPIGYITNIINENKEIILSSVAGGTVDPTDPDFTGVVISPSGQVIDGVLYHFALVIDGVVFNGLADDGGGLPVVTGGDVVGPESSIDNHAVTFDGTTGKLVQDSGLQLRKDASDNIIIGETISPTITSAGQNIGMGNSALSALTTGDRNVAIGDTPLPNNDSGNDNIAIGLEAMYKNESGSENIALGHGALDSNIVGDNNVAIGKSAMQRTNSSNNVAIGFEAGFWDNDSSGSKLYVDTRRRIDLADSRDKALIYGIFDDDDENQELHFNSYVYVKKEIYIGNYKVMDEESAQTVSNKRIIKRTASVISSATPTIDTDAVDVFLITALATNITSMTTNLSGSPTESQSLLIIIADDGTPRTIAWGSGFDSTTIPLPTATVASTRLRVALMYNAVTGKFDCVGVS